MSAPDRDVVGGAVRGVVRLSKTVESILATDQLSVSQFRILDRLVDGSTHGRGLADWLAVKPPSLTNLVDGLVKRGLVNRTESGTDRRQVTHAMTPAGEQLHREVSERIAVRLRTTLSHLSDPALAPNMIAALSAWDEVLSLARVARDHEQEATAK